MGPLPYPHRATFLASAWSVAPAHEPLVPYLARLISVIVFDHLIRHPVVTLGDHDDERLIDDAGRLLDARHPQIEDSIDWFFRVSRRHEVLWFELGAATVLHARRPDGARDAWIAGDGALSDQLGHGLAQWLAARRLPPVAALPRFDGDDLRALAERLRAADDLLVQGRALGIVPRALTQPPARLPVPYLRVLAELSRDDARTLDPIILAIDPTHPVARRNRYVTGLLQGDTDRRAILPIVEDAPMYARPHLSIWGEPFAADRALESMGVRHQGIAASLMPANPYACHNYSLQLAEDERREESYRWADRATVAAPDLGAAHLDCVRRLRQVGRPGQAFAEAQYRCREILDRAAAGKLAASDWQAPHQAALLVAFVHLDVGRLAEAIELADDVLAQLPEDPATHDAFAWAAKRIAHWKTDPALYARAYAWEGHHRGDVARVLVGLGRGRIASDDDAMMLIDALIAVGRADLAETAYWQCAGLDGVLGDGKARLAAARALILTGDLDEALDQIQTVQLRRGQSRLEAEINRLLRLAACHPAEAWREVIARRLERGARTLARMAARDLADFVPGIEVDDALGDRVARALDPLWLAELIAAVPAAHGSSPAIVARLAVPAEATLAAADALAEDWWTALVPSARDRDAHAAGAVLALGLAVAHYLVLAAGPATPLAGAYRHIATEALHLVRRARYQVDPAAIAALLQLLDRVAVPDPASEWLVDTWLLRVERALDLEAEQGAYLDGMLAGLPNLARLVRGDDRIGWELRLAHDLAADPTQYEPAAALFARSARAVEAGGTLRAWSAAAVAAPVAAQLDVHWTAALANPTGLGGPWLRLAQVLLATGHAADGFEAACRGMFHATPAQRARAGTELAPAWRAARLPTPLDGQRAYELGVAAAAEDRLDVAVTHLRWAAAAEPGNAIRGRALATALARLGLAHHAIRVLSHHERVDAPRMVGRILVEHGLDAEAVRALRYAALRFRTAGDWAELARVARRAGDDPVAAQAGRRAIALGASDRALDAVLATSLYRIGEFVECEAIAQRLIAGAGDRAGELAGLHAMARALAGQGRHVDAHPYAKAAEEMAPDGELAAELAETMALIVGQHAPPVVDSPELGMERQACEDLAAGQVETLVTAVASPSWGIARVALAACELRTEDENGIPVAPRALDAAASVLARSRGATFAEAVLARIRALRIRDNAFIQIDPPPPLGVRATPEDLERALAERERRPRSPTSGR
jgi:tetratricopeptide (TPR) repeat protein